MSDKFVICCCQHEQNFSHVILVVLPLFSSTRTGSIISIFRCVRFTTSNPSPGRELYRYIHVNGIFRSIQFSVWIITCKGVIATPGEQTHHENAREIIPHSFHFFTFYLNWSFFTSSIWCRASSASAIPPRAASAKNLIAES